MSKEDTEIVARECRFAIHIREKHGTSPDLHLVKEQRHMKDGSIVPALRWIKDYKRPYWITNRDKQKYKDKREWSSLEDVSKRETTQSKLRDDVAKALNKQHTRDHMKLLAQSPYLYGTDITSTSLIKKMYMDKFPDHNSPFTVATYDIETDVLNGTNDPIMASVIFKKEIFIVVDKAFVRGFSNTEELVQAASRKYIGEYLDKHEMKITLSIAENPVDIVRKSFAKVHELMPDFLAIWNMDFDIPRLLETLEKYGEDPRDFFCDPSVPKSVRVCKYKQGPKKKVTASGKVIPINPAAQWHTLVCTASYYVIDAMCAYKHLRLGEQEESSYSLDNILSLKLGIRKLKFKEADMYSGLRWHQFMQSDYKIEYMVYNIFDCLSMIELDQKTKDLAYTLPSFAATTDFANFKSQPRRISDALHFYAIEQGYVMGTVGAADEPVQAEIDPDAAPEESDKDDNGEPASIDAVLDRTGWVN